MKTRHVGLITSVLIGVFLLWAAPSDAAPPVVVGKPVLPLTTTLVTPPIFANTFECAVVGAASQNFSFKVEILTLAPGGGTLAENFCTSSTGCWVTATGNGYPGYCRIIVGGTNTPAAARGALKGLEYRLTDDGDFAYLGTTTVEAH